MSELSKQRLIELSKQRLIEAQMKFCEDADPTKPVVSVGVDQEGRLFWLTHADDYDSVVALIARVHTALSSLATTENA